MIISRNKEPVVRLVREALPKKKPLLGAMKGRMGDCGDEAMAPLPDDYLGLDLWDDKPL